MDQDTTQLRRALILAAGNGTRLRSVSGGRPKILTEVNGHSILEWQRSAFRLAGICEEALVTGFAAELLSGLSSAEFYNAYFANSNMLWSLASARQWLDRDVVVSYSDILYTHEAVEALTSTDGDIVVACDPHWQAKYVGRDQHPLSEAEVVEFDANGTPISIGKRKEPILNVRTEEFIGLMRLSREGCQILLHEFDEALRQCSARNLGKQECWLMQAYLADFLTYLIEQGVEVQVASTRAPWIEIDTPQDFARAKSDWNEPFRVDC